MGRKRKGFFTVLLALFMVLGLAFTIMASNTQEDYGYPGDTGRGAWDCDYDGEPEPGEPDDWLDNNTRFYVTGNFASVFYRQIHRPVYGTVSRPGASVSGTLVSHANFAGTWTTPNQTFPIDEGVRGGFYARPNGNANNMHNGFTFIEINVAELAANPYGVNVVIARSNQSNGNLPNASWNTPIEDGTYTYNVRIVDGRLVATVNGFASGSWGATVTNNLANWGNNPNSAIRHQRNASINLGNVSGTVFLFFHAQNLTFESYSHSDIVIGCEVYFSQQLQQPLDLSEVDYYIAIWDMYGNQVYTGLFGHMTMPLPYYIEVGTHYFTITLSVDGNVVGEAVVVVDVSSTQWGYRNAIVVYGDFVDFGTILIPGINLIFCDWCQ